MEITINSKLKDSWVQHCAAKTQAILKWLISMSLNAMLTLDGRRHCKTQSEQVQMQTGDFYHIKSKQAKQARLEMF